MSMAAVLLKQNRNLLFLDPVQTAVSIRQSIETTSTKTLLLTIAKQLSITLCEQPLVDEINAISFHYKGRYVIGINECRTTDIGNFIIAHELGHFILHPRDLSINLRDRHCLSQHRTTAMDVQANSFALELLMPENCFREKAACFNVPALRDIYSVSEEVICFRLKQLGLKSKR